MIPTLTKPMLVKVDFLLKRSAEEGFDFRLFKGNVDPWDQARLWRQSRCTEEIDQALAKLRREGALFLEEVLRSVGPQYGRWATNDLPGQSWHQYGEAVALMLVSPAKKTIWSSNNVGYERLATLAQMVGLHSGWYWRHRDANHLQLKPDAVRAYFSWAELDSMIQHRYGEVNDDSSRSGAADQDAAGAELKA